MTAGLPAAWRMERGAGIAQLRLGIDLCATYWHALLLIWLDDGTFVNLALIVQGAAEAVVLEPNLLYADEFEAAEDAAQAADLGLWGACR